MLTWKSGQSTWLKRREDHKSQIDKKARGRFDSDSALCAGALLFGLPQQAQTNRDKRQNNADDGLAAEQAAGDNQALFLEGGVLGSPLLVRKTSGGVAVGGPLVVGELDAGAQECRE